jgi:2-polyprenyl-3-methyl-5-hydroxy-6-metoxy-1,4-benzoquinol methylase
MSYFECPKRLQTDGCRFVNRPGSIRDAPEAGIKECRECSLVIHDMDLRHLVAYESSSMRNWSSGYGLGTTKPSSDTSRRLNSVLDLSKENQISKVLDFGCGEGSMLRELSKNFSVCGFEPDKQAREICARSGFEVFSDYGNLQTNGTKFDLITLFHVVEHLYEPSNVLSQLKSFLRPGGLLVIETPNSMDALLTLFESEAFQNFTYWSHHPMLYSPTALGHLVSRSGFKVVKNICVQRYSLANHLYWLSKSRPGGHEIWQEMFSDQASEEYSNCLIDREISDTLWLVAISN